MPKSINIDHKHSRAIVREIGEKLRTTMEPERELPANVRTQINRLRELEERSPSIRPAVDKPRRCDALPLHRRLRPNRDEQCHRLSAVG